MKDNAKITLRECYGIFGIFGFLAQKRIDTMVSSGYRWLVLSKTLRYYPLPPLRIFKHLWITAPKLQDMEVMEFTPGLESLDFLDSYTSVDLRCE